MLAVRSSSAWIARAIGRRKAPRPTAAMIDGGNDANLRAGDQNGRILGRGGCSGGQFHPAMIDTHRILVSAIEQKRRLRLRYDTRMRLVEPQCYGIGTSGSELLRVHQLRGGEAREPLFTVSKITDLEVLDEVFVRPGPNYKKDDSAMKIIFAQL
jgi:hypothetical protein